MTCIVGIAAAGTVWIGGDSAATSGWNLTVRADAKVFSNGPMVFGFTTSFRMGQLLRYGLDVPAHHPGVDLMQYLCTTWVDAVRAALKDGGCATNKDGAEKAGEFLVGYQGRLFKVCSDYQIGESVDGFDACGCGEAYALGALHGSTGTPKRRIRQALAAAERFSAGVAGPFAIVKGGEV